MDGSNDPKWSVIFETGHLLKKLVEIKNLTVELAGRAYKLKRPPDFFQDNPLLSFETVHFRPDLYNMTHII